MDNIDVDDGYQFAHGMMRHPSLPGMVTWKGMSGTNSRIRSRRCQGHSFRNLKVYHINAHIM